MSKYVMALDQGTTSSRAIIFDEHQNIVNMAQKEFTQHYPKAGWVEHDPLEIYASQYGVLVEVLARSGMDPSDRLELAGARLEEALARHSLPEFLRDRAVFIDEFDTFNAPKQRLLGALLAALGGFHIQRKRPRGGNAQDAACLGARGHFRQLDGVKFLVAVCADGVFAV